MAELAGALWTMAKRIQPVSSMDKSQSMGGYPKLSRLLRKLGSKARVVMETTGNYYMPMASFLYGSGFYVSMVNAMLVHGYGNSLWRAKTAKKDAIKLAYVLTTGCRCLGASPRMMCGPY